GVPPACRGPAERYVGPGAGQAGLAHGRGRGQPGLPDDERRPGGQLEGPPLDHRAGRQAGRDPRAECPNPGAAGAGRGDAGGEGEGAMNLRSQLNRVRKIVDGLGAEPATASAMTLARWWSWLEQQDPMFEEFRHLDEASKQLLRDWQANPRI